MKCPVDGTTLVIADRQGVEIDYCPQCRGVWLDRGELDKLIERAVPPVALQEPRQAAEMPQRDRREDHRGDGQRRREHDRYDDRSHRGRDDDEDRGDRRRRKSFLSELFDFD